MIHDLTNNPENAAVAPGPKRPNCLYLQPFSIELRETLRVEAEHLNMSLTQYIQGILTGLGLRGRADTFSSYQRSRAMMSAKEAIFSARKRAARRSIRS